MFECLLGKRLRRISVYEPWGGARPGRRACMPLFGAIGFEFDDVALACTSPLRYSPTGTGLLTPDDNDKTRPFGFQLALCLQEELADIRNAIAGRNTDLYIGPGERAWRQLHGGGSADDAYPGLHGALGCRVQSIQVRTARRPALTGRGWDALDITFAGPAQTLRISYREDLDGALQVAAPDWQYEIQQIDFDHWQGPFGWLAPDAPYAISSEFRRWPDLESYLQWLALRQQRIDNRPLSSWERDMQFEHGMRLKLEQHASLKRRFLAIRYPVKGEQWDEDRNFALQSLVLQYKIHAQREAVSGGGQTIVSSMNVVGIAP